MTTVLKGLESYWPLARSLLMREPGFDRCSEDSIEALLAGARLAHAKCVITDPAGLERYATALI